MRDALVFSSASQLDFQDVRANVIRIPEVVNRIREAQSIWDTASQQPLDLTNFIASDDSIFLRQIRMKSFATAVVQVGLLDRYLRQFELPEFVVGVINGDSPLRVAVGQAGFLELVTESPALGANPESGMRLVAPGGLPVLSGVQIAEYAIYRRLTSGTYERVPSEAREMEAMLLDLVDRFELNRIVSVGPGNALLGRKFGERTAREVHVLESIDLDPMLAWFWTGQRESRLALAN